MSLNDFAARLQSALGASVAPSLEQRLAHLYAQSAPEVAEVDDQYEELRVNFLSIFDQAFWPLYYFSTVLNSPQGRAFCYQVGGQTPAEYAGRIYTEVTRSGAVMTDLAVLGDNVRITLSPDAARPFSISIPADSSDRVNALLKPLGIKNAPGQDWEAQDVPLSLKQYAALNFDDLTSDYDAENGGYPSPDMDENYEALAKTTGINLNYVVKFRPGDNRRNGGFYKTATLSIDAVLMLPVDFFHWLNGSLATTAARMPKFPFSVAWQFMSMAAKAYGGHGSWPVWISSPQQVKNRLDKFTGVKGFQPRVSPRGWTIMPDGGFFKPAGLDGAATQRHGEAMVERQEKLDALYSQLSQLSRAGGAKDEATQTQITNLEKQIGEVMKFYQGKVAVIDWVNDKMLRWTQEGNESLEDLTGARALDPVTEYDYLERQITDRRLKDSFTSLMNRVGRYRNDRYNNLIGTPQQIDYPENIQSAYTRLVGYPDVRLKHFLGIDLEDDFADVAGGQRAIADIQMITNAVREAYKDPAQFFGGAYFSEYIQSGTLGWMAETIGTMDQATFARVASDARRESAKTAPTANITNFSVPNVELRPGKFDSLMPHQADDFKVLGNFPKLAFADISAGGGKTTIGIIHILKLLEAGLIKRPMVTTAGNLVPAYITEINMLTNGKVNAVPLRVDQVLDAITRQNMKSYTDFVAWVQSFPPNTIFVNAYTDYTSRRVFFDDLDCPAEYGTEADTTYQFRQLMGACGFDFMKVDESQFIKNKDSNRTKGTTYLLSRSEYRMPASGTMINNTVLDLHGQVSAAGNGAVFGTLDDFASDYSIDDGIIQDASKAIALRADLRKHGAMLTNRKQDWAFLLPDMKPEFIYCRMTSRQTAYYNRLMTEALIEIRRELEELEAKGKGLTEEEMEQRIASLLQYRLAKVEQYLVAPDLNKDFTHPESGGDGGVRPDDGDYEDIPADSPLAPEDLSSPEVEAADARIDLHLASGRTDKIIVFGYHKAASKHFMKHSRHADKCIRYTAGNLDVITKFKDPKGPFILVADENSMKQGHNLQIAGRIIRLQAVWAPGDYEQAISRMFRPDPRGVYNRQFVNHDWILPLTDVGGATLGVAKTARMISKAISNAQVSNADDIAWRGIASSFEDLPLLSMNLELVFDFKMDDARAYFDGWKRLGDYEAQQMKEVRKRVGQKLEAQHGVSLLDDAGNVRSVADFVKYAMVPIAAAPDLPGSRRVHVPWIENADPADPHGLKLELVSDDPISENDFVVCEFGPGIVKKVGTRSCKVQTAVGIVTIARNTLARPAVVVADPGASAAEAKAVADDNLARQAALRNQWANLNRYALVPPGMKVDTRLMTPAAGNSTVKEPVLKKPGVTVDLPPSVSPDDVKPAQEDEEQGFGDGIDALDLQAGVINGMPILYTLDPVDWMNQISAEWVWVDEYLGVAFTNYKGAENFLDAINAQFSIPTAVMNRLRAGALDMQRGRGIRADTLPNTTVIKNFFTETHRKLGSKDGKAIARPYWLTRGTEVRLVFCEWNHDPAVLRWLRNKGTKVPGVKTITRNPGLWVNFYKTPREAFNDASTLVKFLKGKGIKTDVKALNAQLLQASDIIKNLRKNTTARDAE